MSFFASFDGGYFDGCWATEEEFAKRYEQIHGEPYPGKKAIFGPVLERVSKSLSKNQS